jgi:hypothetical protein
MRRHERARCARSGRFPLPDGKRHRQVFLDGDLTGKLRVAGAVGDAEAALAQNAENFVAANLAADRQRYVVDGL